ncbi:DUF1049 domain-containing protein [Enterococcus faecalis]|uniref:DUF1049 domain-containing protein n=1 Tax=Enterococcus faecalis TaxID=1351 RepID=UPI000354278C|nr:DUF1049 domain-containing protein [Enterococcus faecalis]EIQ7097014.1 DUF1049 domain-containing protein [Enterococcus faecalis]EPI39725.1 hypothetical protein D347_00939 [Enterococcus faecalis LA3B-2]MDU2264667.1 DUF1049 domain-containing protein [Enterococcus faecalis]HAP3559372.1 DUF1049 domain-containing protein [Enterococcus faecalis]HBI2046680.1 DUF1049 domain-containing protein [Enterococcus faecalis]
MERLRTLATPKRIVAFIIAVLVLIFAFQNLNTVELKIVFFTLNISLLFLIIGIFILGLIVGWTFKRNDLKKVVENIQKDTKKELSDLQDQLKK